MPKGKAWTVRAGAVFDTRRNTQFWTVHVVLGAVVSQQASKQLGRLSFFVRRSSFGCATLKRFTHGGGLVWFGWFDTLSVLCCLYFSGTDRPDVVDRQSVTASQSSLTHCRCQSLSLSQ